MPLKTGENWCKDHKSCILTRHVWNVSLLRLTFINFFANILKWFNQIILHSNIKKHGVFQIYLCKEQNPLSSVKTRKKRETEYSIYHDLPTGVAHRKVIHTEGNEIGNTYESPLQWQGNTRKFPVVLRPGSRKCCKIFTEVKGKLKHS